jgi:hypothetical protein
LSGELEVALRSLNRPVLRWTVLLLVLIAIFGLPALASSRIPALPGTSTILETDPRFVFIGNSMLETRIDLERLEELTDGAESISFVDGGLGAAAWYLRLKNYVVGAGAKPESVFILFRDDALTESSVDTSGEKRDALQRLKGVSEPEYDAIATGNSNFSDEVDRFFDSVYPVQGRRSSSAEAAQRISASPLMPGLLATTLRRGLSIYGVGSFDREAYRDGLADYESLKQDVNSVFDRVNSRQTPGQDGSRKAPEFDEVVDASFLPLILDLGRDHDIQLVFVRVQRRPEANGDVPGSSSLDRYVHELSRYLGDADAGFVDLNGDPNIRLEHYLDTDHITPGYMNQYTEIFFQKSLEYFVR